MDSEGDFAMGVNQVAKATDGEIMGIASSEFYKLTGRRNVPDVSEVFSRGRFTSRAKEFGMVPGFALDYRTGWDLSDPRQAEEEELLRRQTRPKFLLGSPPCSAFSQLLTFASATPDRQDELVQEGMKHLRLSCKMYIEQMNEGNDFVHEHPH